MGRMNETVLLPTPEATLEWGRSLAAGLRPGGCIALCGGLGAGKTQAAKGIAAGLGCDADVTSPTFSIVHEYSGGRLPVFHFDLYRIESEAELLSLGWDEYADEGGIMIVEWADRFPRLMPASARWFCFSAPPGGGRQAREGGRPS